MPLEAYRTRRDFAKTPEPAGEAGDSGDGRRFVVQKHGARRLHYDLRLEHEGVLWSWAVTRGPSLRTEDKRLAVRTEDHPLDYAEFEGVIPARQYGAGPVLLWDRGTWEPVGDPAAGEKKGHLEFTLNGERLRGRWHLVRMARRRGEKADNWLLIKVEDEAARGPDGADILEEAATSVASGLTLEEIAEGRAPREAAKAARGAKGARGAKRAHGAKRGPRPGFIPPALATLRDRAPAGDRWIHEIKFDGYRVQAHVADGEVRLYTRSGHDWTSRFGARIPKALARIEGDAVLDGEVVVEDASGISDFGALQADLADGRSDRMVYYAFDLLHADGRDLRAEALDARKAALDVLLAKVPEPVRFSGHFEEEGEVMLRHACRLSLEGLVSKRRDAPYRSGRSTAWVKSKCLERRDFVILGYAPSQAAPDAVGALLLGRGGPDGIVPVGRVGTGFSRREARALAARLEPLRRKTPASAVRPDREMAAGIRFVKPELVAEVEFLARTREGSLRHASYRGLREDRPPAEVVEAVVEAPADERPKGFARLTSPDRLYWPEVGVTKERLGDHYIAAWRRMAPHLVRRPLALLRCPRGYTGHCFFQKHAWKGASRHVLALVDPLDEGEDTSMVAVDGLPGLGGLVQAGALEIHTWQASVDDLERPDQIVMDLDPGEGVEHDALIEAAREVRARLEAAGLAAFLKTTGGKGYHVVAPLRPEAGWAEVKGFAKGIADAMAGDAPGAYVATLAKAKRRGRILIDYLRNGRGATAVAPYSTRARAGATVSMPIGWEELDDAMRPDRFSVADLAERLDGPDPWEGFAKAAAPLRSAVEPGRRKAKRG